MLNLFCLLRSPTSAHQTVVVPKLFTRVCCGYQSSSTDLKKILGHKILEERENIKRFRKDHGGKKVGEVTVNMIYGGMRGILGLVWEPSVLDEEEGIRFRGLTIPDCQRQLPTACSGQEPLPESMFILLLTGEVPSSDQVSATSQEWADRSKLPKHVTQTLNNYPKDLHPISQFSSAITILNSESEFVKAYQKGISKMDYREYVYEDAMNLIAKIPVIAAIIYNNLYKSGGTSIDLESCNDWAKNFAIMMGYNDSQFIELLRLYLTIHADHEGGNVSAHATHLVGSALSDPYLSFAAGMNGLAGPLHGLANQEVLLFINKLIKKLGDTPSDEQLKDFITNMLKSGQVVPGFGHAVLRKTDPRYTCQLEFGKRNLPDDKLFKLVLQLYEIVPPILQATGKVKNPWPNVDADSGVLLQHFGLKEMNFYTVLFGVSRSLGTMANLIWSRALGFPIERPKSTSTELLQKKFSSSQ